MMHRRLCWILSLAALLGLSGTACAQQTRLVHIKGTVRDAATHLPLAEAEVRNAISGRITFTDSAGSYQMEARNLDWLMFSAPNHEPDSMRINDLYTHQLIDVVLQRNSYGLRPVEVLGHRLDYSRDSAMDRSWFAPALDQQKTRGLQAAMSPVSALYDALSGRQKRLWRFQRDYEKYQEQQYIRSRVRPGQIQELFGLGGDSLNAFLNWYKPSYLYVRQTTDYDLLMDIKRAIGVFRMSYDKQKGVPFLLETPYRQ